MHSHNPSPWVGGSGFQYGKIERPWTCLHNKTNILVLSCIPKMTATCFKHNLQTIQEICGHASSKMKEAERSRCPWGIGSRPTCPHLVLRWQELLWLGPSCCSHQSSSSGAVSMHTVTSCRTALWNSIYLKILVFHLASPRGDLPHRAKRKVISLIVPLTQSWLLAFFNSF